MTPIWLPPEREPDEKDRNDSIHIRFTHSEPALEWYIKRLDNSTIEESLTTYQNGKPQRCVWHNGRRFRSRGKSAHGPAR